MKPASAVDAAIEAAGGTAAMLRAVGAVTDGPAAAAYLSEIHLADLWVQRSPSWRYVKEWDMWMEWRGNGWYRDTTGAVRASIADLLRESEAWADSAGLTGAQRRKLCSAGTVSGITAIAQAHRSIAREAELWDADPMMLGIPGGIVDLHTGEAFEARQEDYITRRTSVAPEPGPPVLWLQHLMTILKGDMPMVRLLQTWAGYCLTGETGEHAMLMGIGTGANGKSATFDTFMGIMGEYGYAAPINLLMESHQERHPAELAMLQGRRFVLCSEPPQSAKWDDGRLRSLTGDKTLTARKMNKDFSTFVVTHKLSVMGNHTPILRSVDEAIKRRINIVQFSHTIPVADRDPRFLERLRGEWPRILNWMIEGCMIWQREGLKRPPSMLDATSEYLADEDTFGQFIGECCERGPSKFDLVSVLWKKYAEWCEKQGEKPVGRKAFKQTLLATPGIARKSEAGDAVAGCAVKRALDDVPDWR